MPHALHRSGPAPVAELPEFTDDAARGRLPRRLMPVVRRLTPERAAHDAGAYPRWLAECPAAARWR